MTTPDTLTNDLIKKISDDISVAIKRTVELLDYTDPGFEEQRVTIVTGVVTQMIGMYLETMIVSGMGVKSSADLPPGQYAEVCTTFFQTTLEGLTKRQSRFYNKRSHHRK